MDFLSATDFNVIKHLNNELVTSEEGQCSKKVIHFLLQIARTEKVVLRMNVQ